MREGIDDRVPFRKMDSEQPSIGYIINLTIGITKTPLLLQSLKQAQAQTPTHPDSVEHAIRLGLTD